MTSCEFNVNSFGPEEPRPRTPVGHRRQPGAGKAAESQVRRGRPPGEPRRLERAAHRRVRRPPGHRSISSPKAKSTRAEAGDAGRPRPAREARASSVLATFRQLPRCAPALGARGSTTSPAPHVRATGAAPARPPRPGARPPPPRRRRGPAGERFPRPPRRRASGGGARAPAPLKFESRHQQVRNPETPDPHCSKCFLLKVEGPVADARREETLCGSRGLKLFITCVHIWVMFVRLNFVFGKYCARQRLRKKVEMYHLVLN